MHDPEDRSFLGHPRGLGYIAFTEAWERFSYYGMQALLVLFMVNYVLHPGHIEHIAGLIADRWLGRTITITIGACLMAAGQFLVGLDVSFLLGLVCLLIGVGCFKGNLASQVGGLYATGDNRRADAFQIYYIFINAGVIAAPLIAGTLGEKVGWAWGFDACGVGMLIGLA